jgi:hypothetical protein
MTWSLQIRNGDLNFAGPGGFAVVSGTQKLVQDIRHWLLEPRGTDPMHADYGSTLDGGQLSDGSIVGSSIGGVFSAEDTLVIEAEIRRVLNAYQLRQAQRLQTEVTRFGGKNTFSTGEILRTVNAVEVKQLGDTAVVTISITTANGDNVKFVQPLA